MTVDEEVKEKLKEMFPEYKGFIQHTLVSSMCLSYHKESSKELVEALKECLVSLKGMDKKYTLDKRRIEQAEKALESHFKEHPTRTNEGSIN